MAKCTWRHRDMCFSRLWTSCMIHSKWIAHACFSSWCHYPNEEVANIEYGGIANEKLKNWLKKCLHGLIGITSETQFVSICFLVTFGQDVFLNFSTFLNVSTEKEGPAFLGCWVFCPIHFPHTKALVIQPQFWIIAKSATSCHHLFPSFLHLKRTLVPY